MNSLRPIPPVQGKPISLRFLGLLWNVHSRPESQGPDGPDSLLEKLMVNLNAALTPAPLGIGSFVLVMGRPLDLPSHVISDLAFDDAEGLVIDVYDDGDWCVYLFDEEDHYKFAPSSLTLNPNGRPEARS